MSEAAKPTWHGILRETIQWHSSVIAERCVGCGMCVTSCRKNFYAFDYESNKPVVNAPQACMIGCTTCALICTLDAIEFPSIGYVRQIIRRNKLLRQAKDTLRATVEKYDIKQHKPVAG